MATACAQTEAAAAVGVAARDVADSAAVAAGELSISTGAEKEVDKIAISSNFCLAADTSAHSEDARTSFAFP